jgi:hypothetical protein
MHSDRECGVELPFPVICSSLVFYDYKSLSNLESQLHEKMFIKQLIWMGLFSKKSVGILLSQISAFLRSAAVDVSRAMNSCPHLVFSKDGDFSNGLFKYTETNIKYSSKPGIKNLWFQWQLTVHSGLYVYYLN